MYDLKIILLYALVIFGIVILVFPDQFLQIAPENEYMKKFVQYNQIIGVLSILLSIYFYLNLGDTKTTSDITTITSSLPTPTSSENLPTSQKS